MLVLIKKILFAVTLNSALFLLLIIGIQNSSNKSKVKLSFYLIHFAREIAIVDNP